MHGFAALDGSGQLDMSLVAKSLGGQPALRRIQKSDLADDPEVYLLTQPSSSRLDWWGQLMVEECWQRARTYGRRIFCMSMVTWRPKPSMRLWTRCLNGAINPQPESRVGHPEIEVEKSGCSNSGEQRCSSGGNFLSRHGRVGG